MVQGKLVDLDGEFWQRSGQIGAFDFLLGGFESVLVTLVLILFYLADTHKYNLIYFFAIIQKYSKTKL